MDKDRIYQDLLTKKQQGKKAFAVLIDPDKMTDASKCLRLVNICLENKVDYLFVGGSLITNNNFSSVIKAIKENSDIPILLFPGNNLQIDTSADAILLLSLISGRNSEFLIGQHVVAAPILKRSNLEIIPTGYILVGSNQTSVSYMSNTAPVPYDKFNVASCTAIAGEMLGLKLIYLEAGSGASDPVSQKMITSVKKAIDIPLIVGGGINTVGKAVDALDAGADLIVMGNSIEKDPGLLIDVTNYINDRNRTLDIH